MMSAAGQILLFFFLNKNTVEILYYKIQILNFMKCQRTLKIPNVQIGQLLLAFMNIKCVG